jgi:molybdate transport system permease protein
MILQALLLTLRLAAVVCGILLIIALPLSYWLASSRWKGKFLVEALVALPIVLPPTVLGFYVLTAIGPLSPLGRWYNQLTGSSLAFTFRGLVVGSVLYSLPFAVQLWLPFSSVDRSCWMRQHSGCVTADLLESDASAQYARRISRFGVAAHTLGEFGVVLLVGGNIPGATQTVSILIYDQVQALNYAVANQLHCCWASASSC